MITTTTSADALRAEATAIAALLDDVIERSGDIERDTLSSLCATVRQLELALTRYSVVEGGLLQPDRWPIVGMSCQVTAFQTLLNQVAHEQVEMRFLIEEAWSQSDKFRTFQQINPVLRVALWSLRTLARQLTRHLDRANVRLLLAVRTFNAASARQACPIAVPAPARMHQPPMDFARTA